MTDPEPGSAKAIERSVVKKMMWGLMPCLAVLYMFNMLDRGNVAIAALTFKRDLHFSDPQYGLGAGIFYIGYFLFEIPSNLIMERVGARRWIARIMISWGVVSAAMMFMRSPVTYCTLRVLLGIAEAGFYPGIILYITYWVPGPHRAQVIARFLAMTGILGVLGNPLSGLLLQLHGYGLHGWQWLFLLEGLPSVVLGFAVLFLLPNGPEDAKWLTPAEKEWISGCLARDETNTSRVHHGSLRTTFSDRRVLHLCLIFIATSIAGNSVGFFGPQLVKARSGGLWSDPSVAYSLSIPAIVGAIAMALAAGHSDRSGNRRTHVVLGYLLAGLAYLACVFAPSAQWIIFALSIYQLGERVAAGSYWAVTTNLLGVRAAAGGIAFINSVGNLGGFFGPVLMGYLKEQSHGDYSSGLYAAAAFMALGAGLACFLRRRSDEPEDATVSISEEAVVAISQPEQRVP
jgi:ACS family tartrate transporter-like MFS transporter